MDALKDSLKPVYITNWLNMQHIIYAPPYLPLHEFSKKRREDNFVTSSVFQWQEPGILHEFENLLKKVYTDYNISDVLEAIRKNNKL